MKKQMSQLGMGIILTLLILGLSQKGIYGKVPVNLKNLPQLLEEIVTSHHAHSHFSKTSQINSLLVRSDGTGSTTMIILVAYDEEVAKTVQEVLHTAQIPLIFSVSTLPFREVTLEPTSIHFQQDQKIWHPELVNDNSILPLFQGAKFGGIIKEGEIHEGIVMLPEWFDIHRPITIRYLNNKRVFSFK